VASVAPAEAGVRIEVAEEGVTADVLRLLVDSGVTSVRTSMPSLEEVYVHLIGDRGLQV
jgi:ABC-2 type transport system ATP-binding protein